ncbi:hypothetical protein [Rathayibacter tritici]|uniref:hypothetical protein n=1 Tax=Rathayibacter tritici TaxID=33888 RepID=UPI000836BBA4|nr:hypothetical protein [Rathayibacter tritici]
MTALTAAPSRHRTAAGRLGSIVRLHFANPATILYTPLAILIVIFLRALFIRLFTSRVGRVRVL